MAPHNNKHLTTDQLSAFLDKQLSAQEQAAYLAHVQTCQQCQSTLADLRQTVALLHALPQPMLPRSFVLPAGVIDSQERPTHQASIVTPVPRTRQSWQRYARNSIRALSTIAAVIGLVFMLSSIWATLPRGGETASSGTTRTSAPANPNAVPSPTFGGANTPNVVRKQNCDHNQALPGKCSTAQGATPGPTSSNVSTPTHEPEKTTGVTSQPAIDLNTPVAHLGLGSILLLLGIIGVFLTRRRQRQE